MTGYSRLHGNQQYVTAIDVVADAIAQLNPAYATELFLKGALIQDVRAALGERHPSFSYAHDYCLGDRTAKACDEWREWGYDHPEDLAEAEELLALIKP
jgi:hypothetical protein